MHVVVYIRVFGECHFWDSARALFRFRCGIFFFRCGIFGFTTQLCGIKKTTPEHRFPWFSAVSPQHEKEKKTGCAQVAGKKFPKHEVKNSARPADLLVRNPKKEIPKHSIWHYKYFIYNFQKYYCILKISILWYNLLKIFLKVSSSRFYRVIKSI